jgi:hypothetical protein
MAQIPGNRLRQSSGGAIDPRGSRLKPGEVRFGIAFVSGTIGNDRQTFPESIREFEISALPVHVRHLLRDLHSEFCPKLPFRFEPVGFWISMAAFRMATLRDEIRAQGDVILGEPPFVSAGR